MILCISLSPPPSDFKFYPLQLFPCSSFISLFSFYSSSRISLSFTSFFLLYSNTGPFFKSFLKSTLYFFFCLCHAVCFQYSSYFDFPSLYSFSFTFWRAKWKYSFLSIHYFSLCIRSKYICFTIHYVNDFKNICFDQLLS